METNPHDIAILDLQLPLMSGMEFFEAIRRDWPATQVIVITGFGDLAAAQRAIHLDVVDFISKPFHLGDLNWHLTGPGNGQSNNRWQFRLSKKRNRLMRKTRRPRSPLPRGK